MFKVDEKSASVMADRGGSRGHIVICNFSATDDSLNCIQHRTVFFIPIQSSLHLSRADIRSIRLSKQGASTLLGSVNIAHPVYRISALQVLQG
jgi:hypothetical protein